MVVAGGRAKNDGVEERGARRKKVLDASHASVAIHPLTFDARWLERPPAVHTKDVVHPLVCATAATATSLGTTILLASISRVSGYSCATMVRLLALIRPYSS